MVRTDSNSNGFLLKSPRNLMSTVATQEAHAEKQHLKMCPTHSTSISECLLCIRHYGWKGTVFTFKTFTVQRIEGLHKKHFKHEISSKIYVHKKQRGKATLFCLGESNNLQELGCVLQAENLRALLDLRSCMCKVPGKR